MLYLGSWLAALTIIVFGDFTNIPAHAGIDQDRQFGLFWIWATLALMAPILALGSLWIIQHRDGRTRYRGLWLRLAADTLQFTAMGTYTVLRVVWGDYHIYPVAILVSATVFVGHLILRDIRRLIQVEQLATKIRRGGHERR